MDPLEVVIDQARRPSTMAINRQFMNFFIYNDTIWGYFKLNLYE